MSTSSIGLWMTALVVGGALVASRLRPKAAGWITGTAALLVATLLAVGWWTGAHALVDLPWNTALGSRFVLALDPLGTPLAVFAAALAGPILYYTSGYLPHHLAEHHRSIGEQARFCGLMLIFLVVMVVLLLAQDLLVMFAALELTALASFLLIQFDRDQPQARRAASVALVLTVGTSLLFVLGLLLIGKQTGTTTLSELKATVDGSPTTAVATGCLVLGVLAKSAQMPLHFWLPRAMVAPTPVSAYLHSATLVAAGVFVLQRLYFLVEAVPAVQVMLQIVGAVSIVLGSLLALTADKLKRILAYSTIAQYGHVVVLVGLGGSKALVGAPLFILAHGLCKCALFLTAGAVTSTTGTDRLSQTGGLRKRMPLLAGACLVAAAGLAGLPATIGYFKDELWLATTLHEGPAMIVLGILAPALTFAYIGRFWLGVFHGSIGHDLRRSPSPALTLPVTALAALIILGGAWIAPLRRTFVAAGETMGSRPISVELGYHALRIETGVALGAWVLGAALLASHTRWSAPLRRLLSWSAFRGGPARRSDQLTFVMHNLSDYLHRRELRDLRDRIVAVLVPTVMLLGLGIIGRGQLTAPVGSIHWEDTPLIAALLVTAGSALATVRASRHLALILLLSFVGFGLALSFAIAGAPDVALVVVVVETLFTMLFLAVLWHIRPQSLRAVQGHESKGHLGRLPGLVTAIAAFFLAWFALGSPQEDTVAWTHVRLAEQAHAKDIVTAILADFRGLDTAGEITVVAIAVLGAGAITWGRNR